MDHCKDAQYALLHAQRVLIDRDYGRMVDAQREAVAGFEQLGQEIRPRVLAGAIEDAGDLHGYQTIGDYQIALGEFIAARRRHAPKAFDLTGLRETAGPRGPRS